MSGIETILKTRNETILPQDRDRDHQQKAQTVTRPRPQKIGLKTETSFETFITAAYLTLTLCYPAEYNLYAVYYLI